MDNFKLGPFHHKRLNNKFAQEYSITYRMQKKYPLKIFYNSTVPLKIFQTWHSKNLPENMKKAIELIKKTNPAFEHHLFDDDDCREFIKTNFPEVVLEAFDSLIPGAYKADLWRYCVLYKEGGIYMDIKYIPHNDFRLINLTEQEHFVLDTDRRGVYNALISCKPANPILFKAINAIVRNVKTKYYGTSCLEPTGPQLLSKFFSHIAKNNFPLKHETYNNSKFISMNGIIVLKMYNNYYAEMGKNEKNEHYSILWRKRKIYSH
jgi:mannosyltransferase OCH1-like enzyme